MNRSILRCCCLLVLLATAPFVITETASADLLCTWNGVACRDNGCFRIMRGDCVGLGDHCHCTPF